MTGRSSISLQWLVLVLVSCMVSGVTGCVSQQTKTSDANAVKVVKQNNVPPKQEPDVKTDITVADRPASSVNLQKEEIRAIVLQVLQELKMQEKELNKKKIEIQEKMRQEMAEQKWMAAAQLADQLPEGEDKKMAFHTVASSWTCQNPAEAAQWAGQLPEGENKTQALTAIAMTWTVKEPAAAAQWVGQLPEGDSRDQVLISMISQLAFRDMEAAAQLANQLPEEKRQKQVEIVMSMKIR